MNFLYKLKARFGKFAIRGLTKYIIATYIVGYIIQILGNNMAAYLSLHPGLILQGEVWRLFTWVLTPPTSLGIFTIIMLIVYYQLGTILERVWGDYFYNLFIFFGLIMTVIGAFIIYFAGGAWIVNVTGGLIFSTYYVSLSIFLGFAMTFPEQEMLLFFIIPLKIKYLAWLDVAYLVYQMIRTPYWAIRIQILCSLASVVVLVILHFSEKGKRSRRQAARKDRSREFKKAVSQGQVKKNYIHKCYICGQTDADNPDLEFRYCSKCTGNKEYCQNHLFTHEHS